MLMNLSSNKVILVLFILILTGSIFAQQPGENTCKAKILIKTNDSSAIAYLNGKIAGDGRNISTELPLGNYSLLLKNNKYQWDSELLHDTLVIKNCDTTINLSYTFSNNKVYVNSIPSNAEVYYRDSLIGYTPLYLVDDLSGIDVKKNEFGSKELNLNGKLKEINLNLDYMGKGDQPSFFTTNLFKLLLGSAVVLGATAAYFKLKADNNFDTYNSTNDTKYLDKTHRYDTISGIAFGAMQVNFGILIYHFLTD